MDDKYKLTHLLKPFNLLHDARPGVEEVPRETLHEAGLHSHHLLQMEYV